MNKVVLTVFSIILISSLSFGELKLKLPADVTGETTQSIINKDIESNLNLNVPSEIVPPSDMKELVKGLMLLGILGDVSFPMGSDSGFKHIAGTAWSAHLEYSYFVSPAFRITFRGGYVNFGAQSEEGSGPGYSYNYEDTFSQIPILIGGYYMFQTGSGFKPYIGLALGMFFQTYKISWTETYSVGDPFELDESFTNSGFGIVPGLGAYYIAGSVLIQFAVEYTYVFTDVPTVEYSYDYLYPGALNKTAGISQETYTEENTDSPSYFSVLLGVSFPVGK